MSKSIRPIDTGIISRNQDKVLRTALAILKSTADAEDVVQDVFVTLYEKQPQFDSETHETAWLLRVTVNRCKNILRSHWWKTTAPLLDTYPAYDDEQQELLDVVFALPVKLRTVIHLYYYEGYSTREIATMTECKESTVRDRLTKARRLLKDFLEE